MDYSTRGLIVYGDILLCTKTLDLAEKFFFFAYFHLAGLLLGCFTTWLCLRVSMLYLITVVVRRTYVAVHKGEKNYIWSVLHNCHKGDLCLKLLTTLGKYPMITINLETGLRYPMPTPQLAGLVMAMIKSPKTRALLPSHKRTILLGTRVSRAEY